MATFVAKATTLPPFDGEAGATGTCEVYEAAVQMVQVHQNLDSSTVPKFGYHCYGITQKFF